MHTEKPLSHYLTQAKNDSNTMYKKKLKIAILSSFTIDGLAETIQVKSAEKNIQSITHVSGYNQYNQDILDQKSDLYAFNPDLTFLILDIRSVLGKVFYLPYSISSKERIDLINQKFNELSDLIKHFQTNSSSKLIITNFALPHYSPYGIHETKVEYGFHSMINDLNKKLQESFINNNSVYVFDFNNFVSKHGEKNTLDFQQYHFGDIKITLNYIPYLANDLMSYIIAYCGLSRKCIVLDLDNTLWGGIIGEDGYDGIKLGPQPPGNAYLEFQQYLRALFDRGILLAINSKNNVDDALKVIREHPYMVLREENFACIRINWKDKVYNMKEIANELNIGLDSLSFFDDDPVNREFVKINLPEVLTVDLPQDPSLYSATLHDINEFNVLHMTEEDVKRGHMYVQQRKRKEFEERSTNLDDFLKNLNIHVSIKNADNFTIPRISQLTLKTNQFNLTTKRYQEEDIHRFAQDQNMFLGCAKVEDKFGDNGITSVFIVKKNNPEEWFLDTFLLSCRVMGREVEKGILNHIINTAKKQNVKTLKAQFIPTQRNKPAEDFLSRCGFKKENDFWAYDLNQKLETPNFLKVTAE